MLLSVVGNLITLLSVVGNLNTLLSGVGYQPRDASLCFPFC